MKQGNLFHEVEKPDFIKVKNGQYLYDANFFSQKEAGTFLKNLKSDIDWKQESMQMYGRTIPFPRLSAWYGDQSKTYSFSGLTLDPSPWTDDLIRIKHSIEPISNLMFNSVLLNLYRDGNDSVSWHADDEPELGKNPLIASVSFGATRTFHLKHVNTKEKISIELEHGSLLIMKGEMQHFWHHQIPKTKKNKSARINLTFRVIE